MYQRSRKLCSITSISVFGNAGMIVVLRLSKPHDDVISLWTSVQPECCRCSPSRSRTLLPTSSCSTKSVNPASPFDDDVWVATSITGTKNSRRSALTMSRRHERIVLSREFLVGIVAVDPTRTSIICSKQNFRLFCSKSFSLHCWVHRHCNLDYQYAKAM